MDRRIYLDQLGDQIDHRPDDWEKNCIDKQSKSRIVEDEGNNMMIIEFQKLDAQAISWWKSFRDAWES